MSQTKAQLISDLVQALNFTGTSSAPANGAFLSAANTLSFATNSAQRLTINSAGTATFEGAINIPGKIFHAGDTDTAFGFPAANTVSIETGGGEALRVDSSRRILVGNSSNVASRTNASSFSPQLQLSSDTEAAASISRYSNSVNPSRLVLQKGRGTIASKAIVLDNDTLGEIIFSGWDGDTFTNGAKIEAQVDGTPGDDDMPSRLIFKTTADGSAVPTERLRIDSSGNVGIGTTTPQEALHISGGNIRLTQPAGTEAKIVINEGTTTNGIELKQTATESILRTVASQPFNIRAQAGSGSTSYLAFWTRDNERMRIASSGNVGIGTTAPASPLHIQKSGTSQNLLVLENDLGTNNNRTLIIGGPTSDSANEPFRFTTGNSLQFRIDSTDALTIADNANIGIGTTSPDSSLHVHKGSAGTVSADGNAVLALENSNHCVFNMMTPADKSAYIMMGDPDDINAGQIRYDNNINELLVEVNGSERLRIDDSGKVGIGTSSPTAALHVSTTAQSSGIRLIDSSTSSGSPNFEIISKRQDSNSNTAFAANIYLGKNRTDAKVSSGIILGTINFGGNHTDGSESNISYSAAIRAVASDSFDSKTDMPTDLVFCTGTAGKDRDGELAGQSNPGTERMRINSSGEVRIGNTGSIGQGTNGTMIPQAGIFKHSRAVNGAAATLQAIGNLGLLQVMGDGDAQNSNNNYGGTSDQELKENIVDANSQWNDIKALKVRNYNFKESTGFNTHKQIGVIAQELEAIGMNGLVVTNDDELYTENDTLPEGKNIGDVKEKGYKSVKYSVLYMKAIKALQEAITKIETLETKVAALEAA